jgi:methyl-accepting chemotaxis protein
MGLVAAATQEIARDIQQASNGTKDVSTSIEGVKNAATETGTAADQGSVSKAEISRFLAA